MEPRSMSHSLRDRLVVGLFRQETILHVPGRVGARLWILVSPLGWADTTFLRTLLIAFIVYDLALALRLRRSDDVPSLRTRWILDMLDVALWAVLCQADAPFTAAVVVAGPLVVVTVIRHGVLAGAGAGLGIVVVPGVARLLAGKLPFFVDSLFYMTIAVVLGWVLVRTLLAEVSRQQRNMAIRAQADLVAARLSGRNDVTTGVGTAIDDLQTTILRLTAVGVDAAMALRALVADHKATLAEETRASAMYLRDALDEYARLVRADEPAVARHVFFDVAAESSVFVLTKNQAKWLLAALARIRPTGSVAVSATRTPAGDGLEILVGTTVIRLPISATARVRLTLVPATITCFGIYVLSMSNSAYAAVPWTLTVPLASAVVGYAAVAYLLLLRYGMRLEPWLTLGTLVPFALIALVTADAAQVTEPARVTLIGPLAGLALLLGTVVQPRPAAVLAWCGLGAAAIAVVLSAPAVPTRYLAAELIWPSIAFLGGHFLIKALGDMSNELSTALGEEHDRAADRARRAAAHAEANFLLDVLAEGQALCDAAQPGPVTTTVAAQLAELRAVLRAQAAETA